MLHGELDVWRMCKKSNEIQGSLLLKWYVISVCLTFVFIFIFGGQIQIVIIVLYKLSVHGQYRQWFQRAMNSLLDAYLYMQCMSNKILSKPDLYDWWIISSWICSWTHTFFVRAEQRSMWEGKPMPKLSWERKKYLKVYPCRYCQSLGESSALKAVCIGLTIAVCIGSCSRS